MNNNLKKREKKQNKKIEKNILKIKERKILLYFLLPVYKVFSSKRVDLEEWDYSILPKTRNSRYSFLCDAF